MDECDVCMRDVPEGVSCAECVDIEGFQDIGRKRTVSEIAAWLRSAGSKLRNTVRLADEIEKRWGGDRG